MSAARSPRLARCSAALVALASSLGAGSAEDLAEGPTTYGRLAWVAHGDLDLIGELGSDQPFRVSLRDSLFVGVDTRISLEQPSDFTFAVRDLQYRLAAGWRGRPGWARGRALTAYLAQRGRENVDRPGQPWVQYLAVGAESADFRTKPTGRERLGAVDWRVAAGPVLDDREVEATAIVEGEASLWLHSAVAFDFAWDALVDDGLDGDFRAGPRFSLAVAGGRRASFYLHYEGAENPLGSNESMLLVGFDYDEGALAVGRGMSPPQIDGRLAAGAGKGRLAGELFLRFLFPSFLDEWYPVVWVDGNILTADDTGDLYILYSVGAERPVGPLVAGAWFHHRSNHVLAEPNDRITSTNALEAGFETADWHGPAGRTPRTLDGHVHGGWLVSSDFGEERRWQLRAGGRFVPPVPAHWPAPYLRVEFETGDVSRREIALGLAPVPDLEVELEYLDDEQFFAADDTALLLVARYGL